MFTALLAIALAVPPDAERVRQRDTVEQAAAAVARARAEGAGRKDVAELMAVFRQEAEVLARMEPVEAPSDPAEARRAALAALADATASGRVDEAARGVVAAWLGPLEPRIGLLEGALAATAAVHPPDLAQSMALDVEGQCTAVMLAAAHDATRAAATARAQRLTAAALRRGDSPGQAGGIDVEADARAADAAAARADADAAALWVLRDRASMLRTQARHMLGMEE